MSHSKFAVGDRVSNMGRKGTVIRVDGVKPYPLYVESDDGNVTVFTLDGRAHTEHTRPSLKKLKKKKARYYEIEGADAVGLYWIKFNGFLCEDNLHGHWVKDCGTEKPKGV